MKKFCAQKLESLSVCQVDVGLGRYTVSEEGTTLVVGCYSTTKSSLEFLRKCWPNFIGLNFLRNLSYVILTQRERDIYILSTKLLAWGRGVTV